MASRPYDNVWFLCPIADQFTTFYFNFYGGIQSKIRTEFFVKLSVFLNSGFRILVYKRLRCLKSCHWLLFWNSYFRWTLYSRACFHNPNKNSMSCVFCSAHWRGDDEDGDGVDDWAVAIDSLTAYAPKTHNKTDRIHSCVQFSEIDDCKLIQWRFWRIGFNSAATAIFLLLLYAFVRWFRFRLFRFGWQA